MKNLSSYLKIRATTIGGKSLIEAGSIKIQVDKWLSVRRFKFVEFEFFRKGILSLSIYNLKEIKKLKSNLSDLKNHLSEQVFKVRIHFKESR